jgi:hypothetical protein
MGQARGLMLNFKVMAESSSEAGGGCTAKPTCPPGCPGTSPQSAGRAK